MAADQASQRIWDQSKNAAFEIVANSLKRVLGFRECFLETNQ